MDATRIIETTFPVRYAETDQMGVVHHASYVIWMEEGRSEYMRALGSGYEELERQGHFLALSELKVRYIAAAHYGEKVTVRTRLPSVRSRTMTFDYEIVNAETDAKLVTGQTTLIMIDREGRVMRMPESIRALLGT